MDHVLLLASFGARTAAHRHLAAIVHGFEAGQV